MALRAVAQETQHSGSVEKCICPNSDKQDSQKRLDRLSAIYSDIVIHAEELLRTRCPYRDRHDLCAALYRMS